MKIIILAGGAGTRLWPLSRTQYPKQFVKLKGMDKSILQMTIGRCLKLAGLEDIIIVTNSEYRHLIATQIEEMGLQPVYDNILPEPQPKNTLPAIYNGVKHIRRQGDDIVAVFPSDHLINDEQGFCDTVNRGLQLADEYIVTFGIVATSPETGYGYIQPGEKQGSGYVVRSFREKPELEVAKQYLKDGYLWNAGMFMFRTDIFDEEVKRYSPGVYEAFQQGSPEQCFEQTPSISIDYGVMEHSRRVAVVPMKNDWSDLGSFAAIYDAYAGSRDAKGNVGDDNSILVDCHNSMVMSDSDKPIAIIGLDDVVVIDNADATLICRRDRSQGVKDVVAALKERGHSTLDAHRTEIRPFGSVTTLENGAGYRIMRVEVQPGKDIGAHIHRHCDERWTVLQGSMTAIVDGERSQLGQGESMYMQPGQSHGLENSGDGPLIYAEVKTGTFPDGDIEWL